VGEFLGEMLDAFGALVDGEDLVTEAGQRLGDRAAEAAEPDHRDVGAFLDEGISQ
jgi:hypothetical protein